MFHLIGATLLFFSLAYALVRAVRDLIPAQRGSLTVRGRLTPSQASPSSPWPPRSRLKPAVADSRPLLLRRRASRAQL